MKYIRTKDGIFEVVKEDGDWLEIISNFERKMQCHCVIKKHAVISQSNTIEELCDFIFVKDEYGDYKLYDLRDWKNTDKEYLKKSWINSWLKELYYCIKTEKGLIYVAKMNEDGELCLI